MDIYTPKGASQMHNCRDILPRKAALGTIARCDCGQHAIYVFTEMEDQITWCRLSGRKFRKLLKSGRYGS